MPDNGFVESFNGSFRDECLNETLFSSLAEARLRINAWKEDHKSASISCSTSSATSMVLPQPNALPCLRSGVCRSSPNWMWTERAKLSRHAPGAQAIDYMLKRWTGFTRFIEDGRICLTNNAAERALRSLALGR